MAMLNNQSVVYLRLSPRSPLDWGLFLHNRWGHQMPGRRTRRDWCGRPKNKPNWGWFVLYHRFLVSHWAVSYWVYHFDWGDCQQCQTSLRYIACFHVARPPKKAARQYRFIKHDCFWHGLLTCRDVYQRKSLLPYIKHRSRTLVQYCFYWFFEATSGNLRFGWSQHGLEHT